MFATVIVWEALLPMAMSPKSVCEGLMTACGPLSAVAFSGMMSGLLRLSLLISSWAWKVPGPLGGLNPTPIPHSIAGPVLLVGAVLAPGDVEAGGVGAGDRRGRGLSAGVVGVLDVDALLLAAVEVRLRREVQRVRSGREGPRDARPVSGTSSVPESSLSSNDAVFGPVLVALKVT